MIHVPIMPNWNACCSNGEGWGKGDGGMRTCDKRTIIRLEVVYLACQGEHTRRLVCLPILHHLH
jgi:hypothetical protein